MKKKMFKFELFSECSKANSKQLLDAFIQAAEDLDLEVTGRAFPDKDGDDGKEKSTTVSKRK